MNKNTKKLLGIVVTGILLISIGGLVVFNNPPVSMVEQLAEMAGGRDYPDIEDGLHAMLTGTGAPLPDANRAGPSNLIIAGDKHFVIDAGPGSTKNLLLSGISPGLVDAVFLTHYHSDHIGDLGELMLQRWSSTYQTEPLPIYGPVNVSVVVDAFNDAYAQDSVYREDHHGEENMPLNSSGGVAMEFDIGDGELASQVIYDEDGVKVTMFNVDHYPVYPAVGYKFEYKDRTVVISGDTVDTQNLEIHSQDADLLITEALDPELTEMAENLAGNEEIAGDSENAEVVFADIPDYHITPEQAATIANNANVAYTVFTHILPAIPENRFVENMFLGDAPDLYDGILEIGYDGMFISMPSNSEDFDTTNLLKPYPNFSPVVTVLISLLVIGLIFAAGWFITQRKDKLNERTILGVFSVIMGLLILTRINSFVSSGFQGREVFHGLVESIMLVWAVLYLKQGSSDRSLDT